MTGWKTYSAALLYAAWGIGGYFTGAHDINEGMTNVISALALVGIGHKIEKAK